MMLRVSIENANKLKEELISLNRLDKLIGDSNDHMEEKIECDNEINCESERCKTNDNQLEEKRKKVKAIECIEGKDGNR
jgi:hypothetical protein